MAYSFILLVASEADLLILGGWEENHTIIGRQSEMSVAMIEELNIQEHTFVKILSISVAEEVVTLVGCRMAGRKW